MVAGAFVAAAAGSPSGTGAQAPGAIISTGDNMPITVAADQTIRTTGAGNDGIGINSEHDSVAITVDGEIETVGGDFAHAVHSTGDAAEITVTGTIRTRAFRSYGVFAPEGAGTSITVARSGRIETRGDGDGEPDADFTHAIRSHGDDAVITVEGTVVTDGILSHGIVAQGANAEVTVAETGTIRALGPASYGIFAGPGTGETGGEGAEVTVAGTIEISGNPFMDTDEDGEPRTLVAFGVTSSSNDATITLTETGTIRTDAVFGLGILSTGADGADADDTGAVIAVDGAILTEGPGSYGVFSLGRNADITVGGTIRTRGPGAHGIWSGDSDPAEDLPELTGANSRITIGADGRVETRGDGATAIVSQGEDSEITVDGAILATGDGSAGISATGGGETITVRGRIHAPGEGSYAIFGTGVRALHLLRWDIIGPIMTGPLEELTVTEVGGHLEPSFTLRAARIVGNDRPHVLGTMPVLVDLDGGTVAVLDTTAPAIQRLMTANVVQAVHGALHDRAAAPAAAANGSGRGIAGSPTAGPQTWGAIVSSDSGRGTDGLALGWDGRVYGVVGGVEDSFGDGVRLGVLGGAVRSEAETGITSIDADADTGVLGVYGELGGGAWALTGALLGGYSNRDTTRHVNDNAAGRQGARGDPGGAFAASSLGLKLSVPVAEGYELRPSVRADGLIARYGSYVESGAESPGIAYDSWTDSSANGRAQLGLAIMNDQSAEIELRAGITSRFHSSDRVTARLVSNGDPAVYDVPGDRSVHGGFVGGRLSLAGEDGFSLTADAEYGRATGGERTYSGRLALTVSF